jgi:hypothetical protein
MAPSLSPHPSPSTPIRHPPHTHRAPPTPPPTLQGLGNLAMFGVYHVCKDAIAARRVREGGCDGWAVRAAACDNWSGGRRARGRTLAPARGQRAALSCRHQPNPTHPPPNSRPQGVDVSALGFGDNLLAGGLGGTAFWLACYPADVVKSKLQVRVCVWGGGGGGPAGLGGG